MGIYLNDKYITSYHNNQVFFRPDLKESAISITSHFKLNVDTNEVTSTHRVIESSDYNPDDILFIGTYRGCEDFVKKLIKTRYNIEVE